MRSGKRSRRKRGGQPGHDPHHRERLPPERVTARHEVKPTACRRCGKALAGIDPAPAVHQVVEIPEAVATAVEYRVHRLRCPCGTVTSAGLPDGVPESGYGPRAEALVATMAGAYRIAHRPMQQLVWDLYQLPLALGTVSKVEQRVCEAVCAPVDEALSFVQRYRHVFVDETSWTEAKRKAWLWVAQAASLVAVFFIRTSRGARVAKELLGELYRGYVHSDRWSAYSFLDPAHRQLCWAHLRRHFVAFEDWGEQAKQLGHRLQRQCRRMAGLWKRARDGTLSRADFQRKMVPVEERILALLDEGQACPVKKVAGQCRQILKLRAALFTFVRVEDIEPTNNAAERALRHAVIWRKSSYGTDSARGSRFVERMLTVVTTLRLQRRNVLQWLTVACEARLARRPPPSLLPVLQQAQPLPMAA